MKIKSILKNTLWGFIFQFVNILISFITQKIFIVNLGIEYQGLNSLFTNLISILSISELGIGNAVIFELYKPLHENDADKVNALMSFYQKAYRCISILVLLIGIIMSFFINFFIKNSPFNSNYLKLVFILFVINSSISYLFSYRASLFYADQKNYYAMFIQIIILIITSIFKIAIITITKNYVVISAFTILFTLLSNYAVYWLSNVMYPSLKRKPKKALSKSKKHSIFVDVKDLSISKIVDMSIFQTDNLLISKFTGLVSLGIYSNYSMVIAGINKFISAIFNAVQPTLTNSLVNDNDERENEKILNSYSLFVYFLATFCCCSYLVLFNDLISLWVGKKYIINRITLLLLILSQYLSITNQPVWIMSYASGLFKEIRNIGIISALTNMIISILFGYFWGTSGVVFGTCCCYLVSIFLQTSLTYNNVIKKNKVARYLLAYICRMILAFIICYCTYCLSLKIILSSRIVEFCLKIIICMFLPNIINIIIFHRNKSYIILKGKLMQISRGRKKYEFKN